MHICIGNCCRVSCFLVTVTVIGDGGSDGDGEGGGDDEGDGDDDEGDDDNDVGEMKVSIIMHGPPPHPLSPSYVNESNKCDVQVHYTTIGERGWGGDLHEGIYGVSIVGWV